MKHKILVAYDGTENSVRALEYTANIVKINPLNFEITLFFVLPPLPIDYVEYGDLPTFSDEVEGLKSREELLDQLKKDIESRSEHVFDKALKLLKKYNINNVKCKFSHCTSDIAGEVIKEAVDNLYKTVVIGRKENLTMKERLLGSTAEKITRYLEGCTVWIVK